MTEEKVQEAMQIILHAGDARVFCKEALNAVAVQDLETANEKIKEAQKHITMAHQVQTDAIQAETRGEVSEYSLLFAHAQDTLMTIYSEINIAKQLIKIFEAFDKRISALEQGE